MLLSVDELLISRSLKSYADKEAVKYKSYIEKLDQLTLLAVEHDLSVAQIALAWVIAQGDHVLAIPGTRFEDRAKENLDAASAVVSEHVISKAASILSPESIIGDRWSETILREVDSEQFRFA